MSKKDKILTEIHRKTTMSYDVVKWIYDKTLSYDAVLRIYNISARHNLDIFEVMNSWKLNNRL